jgi:hypothetical protein
MNPFFEWLKDSGTQAMLILVGTIVGIASMVFAGLAAWFAWKAPTKRDLARVEQNTADTSVHLENVHRSLKAQEMRDALNARAQRVSMTASGSTHVNHPMEVTITLKEPDIAPTQIELYNEVGNLFGSSICNEIQDMCWTSTIQPLQFQRWYGSGTVVDNINRKRVKLRVYMLIEEQEVYRDFAVQIMFVSPSFTLDGSC